MEGRRLTNVLLLALLVLLALVIAAIVVDIRRQSVTAPPPMPPPVARAGYQPPMGSNQIFREPTAAAAGHELILADLRMPPEGVGEPHAHPWEEYLYVLEGSVDIEIDNRAPRRLEAGQKMIIPARTMHTPRAGVDGLRAIVARVHDENDEISTPLVGATAGRPQATAPPSPAPAP